MKKLGRIARLGGLTSRVGGSYLGQKVKGAFQDAQSRRDGMDDTHRENARRVAQTMGKLKGAAMKVGQNLAQVVEGMDLPPEVAGALRTLNNKAAPVPFERIQAQVEASLEAPLDELFASVEREPLGTASLAQAHAATMHDGRRVGFKVLHDGVEESVETDLAALKTMFVTGRVLNRSKEELEDLFDEIKLRLLEELDYYNEAANIEAFRRAFADHEGIIVPATVPSHCSDRVLTMDRLDGQPLSEWVETATPAERQQAGLNLADLFFQSVYVHQHLHADPHEGNYLFSEGGVVGLLDFGCVVRYDEHWLAEYARVADAGIVGDREYALTHLREMGALVDATPEAEDLLWQFIDILGVPFRAGRYTAGGADDGIHEKLREVVPRFVKHPCIRTPRKLIFMHRSLGGTYGMLKKLQVRADWGEMPRSYHKLAIDRAEGRLA